MSLRFIYGRAGSGKTHLCLNEIKAQISTFSKPLILLVPEQFTFQAEKQLIATLGLGGFLNTEVLSFRRLAFRIFNMAGGITYPHIHPAGKSMIIHRILDKMQNNLKIFSKASKQPGFVNTLITLITEFKRYNVTPQVLQEAVNSLDGANPLKDKLSELYSIYDTFEETLKQKYRDSDDDLTLASQKWDSISLYSNAQFWIDGFTSFTPQEYELIQKLMQKAQRVNVTFCTTPPIFNIEKSKIALEENYTHADIFFAVKNSIKKLLEIAQKNNIEIEAPFEIAPHLSEDTKVFPRFKQSPELFHLEKNLNSYPYEAYTKKTTQLSLFSSVNIFSEIEATAKDIIRLCKDENMRFRDITLIVGNLESYESLIEIIFTQYNIPYFIDKKVEITNHPLVRMILSMMDIFNENWTYEAVFRYLKTGLTEIPQEDIDKLENYVLACGIRGNKWTGGQAWKMNPGSILCNKAESQHKLLESINNIKNQVTKPLMEFRNKTKGRKAATDFCEALYNFLCNLKIPQKIEAYINNFKKNGDLNLANEYSQVWNIVMEVLDQTTEVMKNEYMGIERFSNVLKMGFSEYKVGLIPASLDQVLVGSIERSKNHETKALYILGANEGAFPPTIAEEGILSDSDRSILDKKGIILAGDTRTQVFDSQYLVYRALTTAKNYLRISWSIADHEGKVLRPSMIISRLRKIFTLITESSNILPSASSEQEIELISYKIPALQYKNIVTQINKDKASLLYGNPIISSVSRLEKFTSCPFSFFVQYGLGAKERRIYRLTPPDIGTFIHTVIEQFSRMLAKENTSWRTFDKEWCKTKVSDIVDILLNTAKKSMDVSKRYILTVSRLKSVITNSIWLIAEHIKRSNFNPIEYEVGFGEGEKYPPITIELDSGQKIKLIGRIDRVDTFKNQDKVYLRIIDYKSGNKSFSLSNIYHGLEVQLATYLDAIWESSIKNNELPVLPGGMLYFKLDDPIIKSNRKISEEELELEIMKKLKMKGLLLADIKLIQDMDNTINGVSLIIPATINKGDVLGKNSSVATLEQFTLLRKHIRQLLKTLCTELIKGNISITPYKKGKDTSCQFCNFLPVCQFDTSMKEYSFRMVYEKSPDDIWKLLKAHSVP